MDLDETWQVGLRPEKTKPCMFPAKSHYGFRREREKMGRRGGIFCEVYDAPLLPLSFIPPNFPRTRVQVVARDTWFYIPEKFPLRGQISRKTVFLGYKRIPDLWPGYGSQETFCDAYTVSIPWWTSHRFILPGWLLLRDVPFSSYPRPNVLLCHGISNGETWTHTFVSNILARGRNDRIANFALVHSTSAHFLV